MKKLDDYNQGEWLYKSHLFYYKNIHFGNIYYNFINGKFL
jgi:hypothetical protein